MTEFTPTTAPVLRSDTHVRAAGIELPNVTDGYPGSAPAIGEVRDDGLGQVLAIGKCVADVGLCDSVFRVKFDDLAVGSDGLVQFL